MGEPNTKTNKLNEKLIASSKVSNNKQNVTIIAKSGPSGDIADNATNEHLSSQHSDNDYNSDAIKSTDKIISNHDYTNKTNHIQSVHNINSSSHQNNINEPEKHAFGKKSFAETTINSTLPKKEHAIVFDSIDNIPQIDYIIAISKLTPPKNIKFASRITNNRFCIYLNDKNTVDFLVDNHPYIIINSHTTIKIRRLINPAKRIIISHVSPDIPNEYIISHLEYHKIQILSPITHINAGFNIPELAHIISFRRQVYIKPDDFEKLPKSILINLENTSHRIFLDDDSIHCFLCKRKGHTTKQCKNPPTEAVNTNINENAFNTSADANVDTSTNSISQTSTQMSLLDDPFSMDTTSNDITLLTPNTNDTKKRPALSSTSSNLTNDLPTFKSPSQDNVSKETISKSNAIKISQPATKKLKRNQSIEKIVLKLDEILEPTKPKFEKIPNKKINYEQFKFIIENSLGEANPASILVDFNITCLEMIEVIEIIKPAIKTPGIKNRLTRLCSSLLDKELSTKPNQTE
ncbi:unnamed protein product [Macrosiphum euphorbiae]|uniref:CCHC-type domain-containing protein n=1 Tax=Macrosiphum euphorbiae TaxID=13131 RepID=A0AAV0VRN8_9HEMI|nr:unnamed protein product [Macrosiphum euphorbiae]CAI6360688.1 unnamed protein product [Macrosiphum euphorbiae]